MLGPMEKKPQSLYILGPAVTWGWELPDQHLCMPPAEPPPFPSPPTHRSVPPIPTGDVLGQSRKQIAQGNQQHVKIKK